MSGISTNNKSKVIIGEPVLTRYERARIVGARALQISHGAPVLIGTENDDFRPHDVARKELEHRVLPIGLSRRYPDGRSQVIPVQWLKDREFISQMDSEAETGMSHDSQKSGTSSASSQTTKEEDLTKIEGIGESSLEALYEEGFTTISSIANASVNALTKVSGVGKVTASNYIKAAKQLMGSEDKEDLTRIKGIGESSLEALYEEGFTTISSIANASVKDLSKVSGVGKKTAEKYIEEAKKVLP